MKKAVCLAVGIAFIIAGVILSLPGTCVSAGAGSGDAISSPEDFAALAYRYACGLTDKGPDYKSAVMYDRLHYSVEKTTLDRIMTARFDESGARYSVTAVLKDGAKNVHLLIGYDLMTAGEKTYLKLNEYEDLSGGGQNAILQYSMTANRGEWIDITEEPLGNSGGDDAGEPLVHAAVYDTCVKLINTVKSVNGTNGSELALAAEMLEKFGNDAEYFDKNGDIRKLTKTGQTAILNALNTPEGSGTFTLGLNLVDPARPKLRYSASFEPVSEGSGSVVHVNETLEFCRVNSASVETNVSPVSVYAWAGGAAREELRKSGQLR